MRRDIIRVLGIHGSLSYSSLMNVVGKRDSGRFAYHLKKLERFLTFNEDDKTYSLNFFGKTVWLLIIDLDKNMTKWRDYKLT